MWWWREAAREHQSEQRLKGVLQRNDQRQLADVASGAHELQRGQRPRLREGKGEA